MTLVVVLLVASSALAWPAAAAADGPTVSLVAETGEVGLDETTTVAVVVHGATDSVGAYEASMWVDSGAVITNVSVGGDPGLERVEIAADGTSVEVTAALMNRDASGSPEPVTIATLTLRGVDAGTSEVGLELSELVARDGRIYPLAGTESASVQVVEPETAGPTPVSPARSLDGGANGAEAGSPEQADATTPGPSADVTAADAGETAEPAVESGLTERQTPATAGRDGSDMSLSGPGGPIGLAVVSAALCLAFVLGVTAGRRR
jgi:hypothetical protein